MSTTRFTPIKRRVPVLETVGGYVLALGLGSALAAVTFIGLSGGFRP